MRVPKNQRRAVSSWLFLCALFALCGVLAILQYRWIGEVSMAARDRLRGSLQATLAQLGQGLNAELAAACGGLVPSNQPDPEKAQAELISRFEQWKNTTHSRAVLHRVFLAIPQKQELQLLALDLEVGSLSQSPWPPEWSTIKSRLEARLSPGPWEGRGGPGPGEGGPPNTQRDDFATEIPVFAQGGPRGGPPPFGRREVAWLIVELNPAYLRDVLLPEVLQRFLGAAGSLEYQVEIVARAGAKGIIYQSDSSQGRIASTADASAILFEPQQFLWPGGGPGRGPGGGRGPERDREMGRWQIYVRHRAGSLEAVVSQARWRNLAIAAGVLLLIMATAVALMRFTRRTQKLAELQMDFVAGVSHELRTPLTVIHTAAYNLRGKMAHDPVQVERYGALIQKESGRLNSLVEQIMRFATAQAGQVIHQREPLSIEGLIDEAMAASKPLIEGSSCVVERHIAPDLPLVLGDREALRHAIENLVTNAAKYGLKGGNWIGIFAEKSGEPPHQTVEIRVADRGPGIPREEQDQIFDPFFRGARAIEDQVRGTGLGLSLVKKIVEAHGGTIRVESESMTGTAFILRLPVGPVGAAG